MFGAERVERGIRYCVWSPDLKRIEVEVRSPEKPAARRTLALQPLESDYHEVIDPAGKPGDVYEFHLGDQTMLPDPASRGQANGVHGPSLVVDSASYRWHDAAWVRPPFRDLVIYELHVGTFTPEGTFRAAIDKLAHLRDLGVNAIELMPIGDFPGRRNWGYDGVLIYAPAHAYGTPDDLRALVDAAHLSGLAVILDVVYNHFGPDGNVLPKYSRTFFKEQEQTPWGAALNFDGERCKEVRRFFVNNPIYWMEHFHIDGFRLDATHAITDRSKKHILAEIAETIHSRGAYAIAEDSRNEARLLESVAEGGYDFDGVWADDFHHIVRVAQTGQREAYFQDFEGTLDELVDALRHGWLFRGQRSRLSSHPRGSECVHLPPSRFIHCLSNHDQIGNRAFGERLCHLISPAAYRAGSMLLCLSPYTPMLFMGDEWAASTPFLYFTDHHAELGRNITKGRREEFAGFADFRDPQALTTIPDPQAEETFLRSKLNWEEVDQPRHAQILLLYKECLRLRHGENAFRPVDRRAWNVARLSDTCGSIRFNAGDADYLLLFHFDVERSPAEAGEPLVLPAPTRWQAVLSSNERRFGGDGICVLSSDGTKCILRGPETLLLRGARSHPY